jgi:hypothetical protein
MREEATTNKAVLRAAEGGERIKRRLEREHRELLEELRALIPGAEVLFGLLIAIRFTSEFAGLVERQVWVYYVALLSTAVSLVLFIAPAAHHRIGFREGDKDYLVRKSNREAIVGSVSLGLALAAALHVVTDLVFGVTVATIVAGLLFSLIGWRWWALAIRRKGVEAKALRKPKG